LHRNLISVSKLDDDRIDCHFSDGKCKILVNNKCVGLAFRQGKLYLLSLAENVNDVCDDNMNESPSTNVNKKQKTTENISLKLWHCRLGQIERLVKESILLYLEFSDLKKCVDCIKGKYVKKIKKDVKRSAGTLEIIHTDICGPFPVKGVDGFGSFITFTYDYSHFSYIYPITKRSEALDKFKIFEVEN
jgi:hypothetical protein